MLIAAVAGCSGGPAAKHGSGTLRLFGLQDPPGFNPLVSDNADLQDLMPLVHGFLLGADARGNFTPDLVEAVPSLSNGGLSRDGRTIRYRLRRGVKWQDGAPFDARDVLFSFGAAMNPNNNVPDRSGFDDVANVRAIDPYLVEVRLRRPYSPALATFFSAAANDPYAILPAHLLSGLHDLNRAAYNAKPVGLGPYRVAKWERGSRVIFEAMPDFRRGAAKIKRIEFRIVPDTNTALTLWESGALDYLSIRGFGGSRAMLEGARSVKDGHEYLYDHYQFNYLMFNTESGPLRDRRVREALVRGIDGDRIERAVRGDLYTPGDGDRLPGQFAYDPSIKQAAYDPAKAARLLDEAGWKLQGGTRMKDGQPLTLSLVGVSGSSGTDRINVQLAADLEKLGIKTSLKDYQYNLLFDPAQSGGIFASGKFDLTNYGWQPGEDADHSYLYRCDTRPPNGENYGRICDPVIEREAKIELESTDPATIAKADRAMLREIDAQSDVRFLGFDREALYTRNEVHGLRPSVLGHPFWNIEQWTLDP